MQRLTVTVNPKSRLNQVIKTGETAYTVNTQVIPSAGKANQAVVKLLAEYFKTNKVFIVKGLRSRQKLVEVWP